MTKDDFKGVSYGKVIEKFKPLIASFYNPVDDGNYHPNVGQWRSAMGFVYGDTLVGAWSNNNALCGFQFRMLGMDTRNYGTSSPERYGRKGDIIVEICYAPHQSWKYYNMGNDAEVDEMIADLTDKCGKMLNN